MTYSRRKWHGARLFLWLTLLDELLPWFAGVLPDRLQFDRREEHWRLIVKGHRRGRESFTEPVVAFYTGPKMEDCLQAFATDLKRGQIYWHVDKYPVDMGA